MSFWSFGVGIWSILVWYRFPAAEEFVVVLDDLDCRQANLGPGLFYYEAMLL